MRTPKIATALLVICGFAQITCSSHSRLEIGRIPSTLPSADAKIDERYLLQIESERIGLTKDYLRLHNPPLFDSLPAADSPDAISFNPLMIVVHYTVIPTLEQTMEYFRRLRIGADREVIQRNGHLNVGVQFVVDRDGTIYRFYPETIIARHVIGLNHVAIGIENVGDGDLDDTAADHPLTKEQLDANVTLVKYLKGRYPEIEFLIGHQEYREVELPTHPAHHLFWEDFPDYRTEKTDPGVVFMQQLRFALRSAGL